jgi:transposase
VDNYYINNEKWQRIYSALKAVGRIRVSNEDSTRTFIEGVYFIMRTGAQWRELPPQYGKWRSVHKRYQHWCSLGVLNHVLSLLSIDYDGESVMIDATIVRSHPRAAGYKKDSQEEQALGRSKGGFTTKIHAVVDALGQALRFKLTGGQRHDITQASDLLREFEGANVIADKGYDSEKLVSQIQNQGCTPVIPPRSNRKNPREYDKHIYKERHLVECFFNKIKQFRRVFSRFDKKSSSFMGFLAFASIILWLR